MLVLCSWMIFVSAFFFPLRVQCRGTEFGVKPSVHGKELPCLSVSGFYLLFCPSYYPRRISDSWQPVGVDSPDVVLPIQLIPQAFLAASSWNSFACRIPSYLKLSLISAMLPSGSAVPSVLTTFLLLVTIRLHFSK